MSEPDNLSDEGTDNAQTHESDNPTPDWDYYDPEEDNVENQADEGTDEDEAQADTDTEAEAEVDEEAQEEADEQAEEPALVTLASGDQVSQEELINGYQRQADYTRKAQDLSNQRNSLVQEAERIERITQTFVDHLASMVPPEPDPQLAYSDPSKFTAQKATYDAAIAQVQKLMELGAEPKQVTDNINQEQHQRQIQHETRMLEEALPEVATKEGKQKFWGETLETAKELGFSQEDMAKVSDHRVFLMAHWARKGMQAEKARSKANAKAQKAPPVAPRKPGQPAKKANRNAEAMRKLARSGSMQDALQIDFD